jgi:DNA-binding response OmpR family regulator
MPSVLLIEDDGVIARSIGAHLRHGGLDVEWAEDGERGLRKLRFERPDVARSSISCCRASTAGRSRSAPAPRAS